VILNSRKLLPNPVTYFIYTQSAMPSGNGVRSTPINNRIRQRYHWYFTSILLLGTEQCELLWICDEYTSVCLSVRVCPLTQLENCLAGLHQIFNVFHIWPAFRYTMYFRFHGWRHIFIPRGQRAESSTTLWLEEFSEWRYHGWVRQNVVLGAKSAIYDFASFRKV